MVTRKLRWSAAGAECPSAHRDAHLLIINDAQEQREVAAMLASRELFRVLHPVRRLCFNQHYLSLCVSNMKQ